jgi:hypothetical protein
MSGICQRKHAISLLFSNDPDLLDFFFTADRESMDWVVSENSCLAVSAH